jgi:tetratricopeptide (TPR) repeat protein
MLCGDAARAKTAFEKALARQEGDREPLLRFAEFALGRIDAEQFKAAFPDLAWYYLGEHALGQGKIEEARLAYMRCLALSQVTWACDWAAWRLQSLRTRGNP